MLIVSIKMKRASSMKSLLLRVTRVRTIDHHFNAGANHLNGDNHHHSNPSFFRLAGKSKCKSGKCDNSRQQPFV